MAWKDSMLEASWRGLWFECITDTRSGSKSLAVKQSPYSDDAVIDDLGNNPTNFSVTAIISGDDYEQSLERLVAALEVRGSGELIHPIYGALELQVQDWSVRHDAENVDSCMLDIQFVQSKSEIKPSSLVVQQVAANAQPAQIIITRPIEYLETHIEQLKNSGSPTALEQLRSITQSVRTAIEKIHRGLKSYTTPINEFLEPPVWVNAVLDDVDSAITASKNITALVDDVVTDITTIPAIENWRRIVSRVNETFGFFLDDETAANSTDSTVAVFQTDVEPLQNMADVMPVSMVIKATDSLIKAEQKTKKLSPFELENVRNTARRYINKAIQIQRSKIIKQNPAGLPALVDNRIEQVTALKKAAVVIYQQVQTLIDQSPPLITYTVTQSSTFRLIAHALYQDHTRAPELQRLNKGLVNPACIKAGTRLNVYAQ